MDTVEDELSTANENKTRTVHGRMLPQLPRHKRRRDEKTRGDLDKQGGRHPESPNVGTAPIATETIR